MKWSKYKKFNIRSFIGNNINQNSTGREIKFELSKLILIDYLIILSFISYFH